MRKVTGYLIDPVNCIITECTVDLDDLDTIHKAIDAPFFDVSIINEWNDSVFVDDEGAIRPDTFKRGIFSINNRGYLFGKGLVLGTTFDGKSVEPHITIEFLKTIVTFYRFA